MRSVTRWWRERADRRRDKDERAYLMAQAPSAMQERQQSEEREAMLAGMVAEQDQIRAIRGQKATAFKSESWSATAPIWGDED